MINSQSKCLGIKVSSLTKTEANTQNSLNNTNDFDYRLKVRHVVDIYIYIYIYIDIVPDVPDTSGESKNNIGAAFGSPKTTGTRYRDALVRCIEHDEHRATDIQRVHRWVQS